jgi:hypothetical protein
MAMMDRYLMRQAARSQGNPPHTVVDRRPNWMFNAAMIGRRHGRHSFAVCAYRG